MIKKYKIEVLLLLCISVLALCLSGLNTRYITKASENSTEKFLDEIVWQEARCISSEMKQKQKKMKNIADALEEFDIKKEKVKAVRLLMHETGNSQFDFLSILDTEGKRVSQYGQILVSAEEMEDMQQLPVVQNAFDGRAGVQYTDYGIFAYAMPVYDQGKVIYVLFGMNSQKSMEEIYNFKKAFEQNITCIVDSNGETVLSLHETDQLRSTYEMFEKRDKKELQSIIEELQTRKLDDRRGIFRIKLSGKEEVFVCCSSLEINGWYLMSMIPRDLFTGISKAYMVRMNLIIVVLSLAFLAFFYIMYRIYESGNKELTKKIFYDEVIGGMNNYAFREKCRKLLPDTQPLTYAIILLDAKNFKLVNEKFGLKAGDSLLRYTYQTILRNLSKADNEFAARSELDHFFICMKESNHERIQGRLNDMIQDINAAWSGKGINHVIGFRQAAYVVEDGRADIEMIQDKVRIGLQKQRYEESNECIFYDKQILEKIKRSHKLENIFEESIKNRDFKMYLQPKIETESLRLEGAEALVRWMHPKEGMIYPSEFIPLFEKNGKIQELDRYMFEEACKYIRSRQLAGRHLFPISVNLSRYHFQNPYFMEEFIRIADLYEVPRHFLEFELTERIFLDENALQRVKEGLYQIHEMGFRCSIDDFGTGYSSLSVLREFEIDVLKLDRSFFSDLSDKKSRDIIKCLIELAKELNVQTVAEGIETLEQLKELKEFKCNLIQGYLFSKPLSISDFEKWEDTVDITRGIGEL